MPRRRPPVSDSEDDDPSYRPKKIKKSMRKRVFGGKPKKKIVITQTDSGDEFNYDEIRLSSYTFGDSSHSNNAFIDVPLRTVVKEEPIDYEEEPQIREEPRVNYTNTIDEELFHEAPKEEPDIEELLEFGAADSPDYGVERRRKRTANKKEKQPKLAGVRKTACEIRYEQRQKKAQLAMQVKMLRDCERSMKARQKMEAKKKNAEQATAAKLHDQPIEQGDKLVGNELGDSANETSMESLGVETAPVNDVTRKNLKSSTEDDRANPFGIEPSESYPNSEFINEISAAPRSAPPLVTKAAQKWYPPSLERARSRSVDGVSGTLKRRILDRWRVEEERLADEDRAKNGGDAVSNKSSETGGDSPSTIILDLTSYSPLYPPLSNEMDEDPLNLSPLGETPPEALTVQPIAGLDVAEQNSFSAFSELHGSVQISNTTTAFEPVAVSQDHASSAVNGSIQFSRTISAEALPPIHRVVSQGNLADLSVLFNTPITPLSPPVILDHDTSPPLSTPAMNVLNTNVPPHVDIRNVERQLNINVPQPRELRETLPTLWRAPPNTGGFPSANAPLPFSLMNPFPYATMQQEPANSAGNPIDSSRGIWTPLANLSGPHIPSRHYQSINPNFQFGDLMRPYGQQMPTFPQPTQFFPTGFERQLAANQVINSTGTIAAALNELPALNFSANELASFLVDAERTNAGGTIGRVLQNNLSFRRSLQQPFFRATTADGHQNVAVGRKKKKKPPNRRVRLNARRPGEPSDLVQPAVLDVTSGQVQNSSANGRYTERKPVRTYRKKKTIVQNSKKATVENSAKEVDLSTFVAPLTSPPIDSSVRLPGDSLIQLPVEASLPSNSVSTTPETLSDSCDLSGLLVLAEAAESARQNLEMGVKPNPSDKKLRLVTDFVARHLADIAAQRVDTPPSNYCPYFIDMTTRFVMSESGELEERMIEDEATLSARCKAKVEEFLRNLKAVKENPRSAA